MEYDRAPEFWWNSITGPQVLIEDVVNALIENEIVALKVPSDLPWRHEMRASTQRAFQERSDNEDAVICSIDIVDDDPDNLNPGKFILQKFSPSSEIQRGYREKSKHSIQEYINAKKVLANRIIWVKGLTGEKAVQWLSFCRGFSQASIDTGLFVLEMHGNIEISDYSNVKCVDFNEYVSRYDVQLFSSFLLDGRKEYADIWKNYVATLTATLCETDAEFAEALIEYVDFKEQSVFDGISVVEKMGGFNRRGRDNLSTHVLRYVREDNKEVLNRRIWKAQVQVLFPIIEMERVQIIENNRETIQDSINDNYITQYGEQITSSNDVELGTLCYMMSRKDNQGLRLLYIPDEEIRERIRFLHEIRNKLAHAECCTSDEVNELLSKK